MTSKPTLLLDCDGILADFVGGAIATAHELTSLRFKREDILGFEVFDYIKDPLRPTLHEDVDRIINRRGWCRKLRPFPEAKAGVKRLQEVADVVVVTAPWNSLTWAGERTEWLKDHFGLTKVIQTRHKAHVHGHYFVDDRVRNVVDWIGYQLTTSRTPTIGIVWDTPHNRLDHPIGAERVHSWDSLYDRVKLS